MNTTTTHWTSIWGNAVSIAENRPESYSKNILILPVKLSALLLTTTAEQKILPSTRQAYLLTTNL